MKSNFHTHSTWCDGRNTVEENVVAAIEKGFDVLGFSSHSMIPYCEKGVLLPNSAADYVNEVRRVADKYENRIQVFCGVEADYMQGVTTPDRARYAHLGLDYIIGSIHYVQAPDGKHVAVDHSPEILQDGIAAHFAGDSKAYLLAYFDQIRAMVSSYDFDVIGHLDLPRKFNAKLGYFDETALWYLDELVRTADAVFASGKLVEVNTGGISRGWIDDAYPSVEFRNMLRERGVKFILSSDAHSSSALDFGFVRFQGAESYVESPMKVLQPPRIRPSFWNTG